MHFDYLETVFCLRLVETLLHFLWQGLAIGLLMWGINAFVPQGKSNLRYRLNLFALLLMAASLPLTTALLTEYESAAARPTDTVPAIASNTVQLTEDETVPTESLESSLDSPPLVFPDSSGMDVKTSARAADMLPVKPNPIASPNPIAPIDGTDVDVKVSHAWLSRIAPYATAIYAMGVIVMLLRLLMAVWGGQRLRRAAQAVDDPVLLASIQRLARRLGLKVAPLVATCSRVGVSVVVGIVKPMILLPPALVTGMSPDQLEAVLSHELAHLRRFDLLVNLLQRLIEAILFFHPAVWYVSRCVSHERENRCDDLVMENGCDRLTYADALLRMAEICTGSSKQPSLESAAALAATGTNPSEFKRRVLRVVGETNGPPLRLTRWGLTLLAAMLVSITALPWVVQLRAAGESDINWKSLDGIGYSRTDGEFVEVRYSGKEIVSVVITTPPDKTALSGGGGGGTVKTDWRGNVLYYCQWNWDSATLRTEYESGQRTVFRFLWSDKSKNTIDRWFSLENGRIFYCDAATGAIEQRQKLKGALPQWPQSVEDGTSPSSESIKKVVQLIEDQFAPNQTKTDEQHGSHDHSHAGLSLEEQMKKVIGRFDSDYWKTVDIPQLNAAKQISFSPDREVLALLRGQTLYAIESFSGKYHKYQVTEKVDLIDWQSGRIHVRTESGENYFFKVQRPRVQFLDGNNDPTSEGRLIEARIGLTSPPSNWLMYSNKPGQPLSLMGLKPGTHWLVTPSRDVFAVSLPLGSRDLILPPEVTLQGEMTERKTPSGTVREVRRRLQPQPGFRADNVSAKASVKQLANGREFLQIEIQNNSGKRLRYSEQNIYLESEVEHRYERALSPNWTQENSNTKWPEVVIEHGSKGVLELDWNRWRSRGLWFRGFLVTSDTKGPGPVKHIPGTMQVRVHGPGFRTNPVALSSPETEEVAVEQPETLSNANADTDDGIQSPGPIPQPVDATTLALYNQYIARVGKIETASINAATELVATRGSRDPKFRALLRKDFATSRQEENQRYDSRKLLTLIAKILYRDAGMRWQREYEKRTGLPGQRALPQRGPRRQGDEVYRESPMLSDVIEYGRKCDRSELSNFVFAIRQAHHPQGKQFLLDVLNEPPGHFDPFPGGTYDKDKKDDPADSRDFPTFPSDPARDGDGDAVKRKWPFAPGDTARFIAAVGLAELGIEDGVRWLIENARPNEHGLDGTVRRHTHISNRSGSLRANCKAALHELSALQNQGEENPIDWDKWWQENQKKFSPRRVSLQE